MRSTIDLLTSVYRQIAQQLRRTKPQDLLDWTGMRNLWVQHIAAPCTTARRAMRQRMFVVEPSKHRRMYA